MTERSKATGNVGDGPPAFVPFSEATSKKHYSPKPTAENRRSSSTATQSPLKHGNQPKQDVKTSAKQTDKRKAHQRQFDQTYEASSHIYRQTGNKPHQHHQAKPSHQRERFQDKSLHGQPSKQRTHSPYHKGHASAIDRSVRSQGQSLSDHLPVTFNSSEEHFPALSHPTNHPQPSFTTAYDKQHQPPHRPMLAWGSQTSDTTTTGGSMPFSAKRKT